jgi:hypothetical protein
VEQAPRRGGSPIWFDDQINLAQPVIGFGIDGEGGQPALLPLSLDPYAPQAVVDSLTISSASFLLAPFGGVSKTGDTLSPGGEVEFTANVDGVPVWVNATVSLDPKAPGDFTSAQIYAAGAAWLTADGTTLGPVVFTLNFSTGLQWRDGSDSIATLATFFVKAGASLADVESILEQFGYSASAAVNAAWLAVLAYIT